MSAPDRMEKRSVRFVGHKTSIAVEREFWDGLQACADFRGVKVSQLLALLRDTHPNQNLASIVRLTVLNHYREIAATDSKSASY